MVGKSTELKTQIAHHSHEGMSSWDCPSVLDVYLTANFTYSRALHWGVCTAVKLAFSSQPQG